MVVENVGSKNGISKVTEYEGEESREWPVYSGTWLPLWFALGELWGAEPARVAEE